MGNEQVSEQDDLSPAKKIVALNKLSSIGNKLDDVIDLLKQADDDSEDIESLQACIETVEDTERKYDREWDAKDLTVEDETI